MQDISLTDDKVLNSLIHTDYLTASSYTRAPNLKKWSVFMAHSV